MCTESDEGLSRRQLGGLDRKAILAYLLLSSPALLTACADLNAKDKSGRTPLHWAAMEGLNEMAEFLIAKGAELNIIDTYGHTPLRIAKLTNHKEIAALLLARGAKE